MQSRSRHVRPSLLRLDDRATPATFQVSSAASSGPGTLGEAISRANAAPDADTITFAPALAGARIDLTTIGDSSHGASALLISSPVTVQGSGQVIRRAAEPGNLPTFRLFTVTASGSLTLRGLILADGMAQGGTGGNEGATGCGGAIYNRGQLRIFDSLLIGNLARGGVGQTPGTLAGGDLDGFGQGRTTDSSIDGYPVGAGLGGAIFNRGGMVVLANTTLTGNRAEGAAGLAVGGDLFGTGGGSGYGGGLFNLNGSMALSQVTLFDNLVRGGFASTPGEAAGGAAYNLSLTVPGSVSGFVSGQGPTGTLTVANSILAGSRGGPGGEADSPFGPVSDVVNRQVDGLALVMGTGPTIVSTEVVNHGGQVSGLRFTVADPQLGPLADHGGLVPTMLPQSGSPALSAPSTSLSAISWTAPAPTGATAPPANAGPGPGTAPRVRLWAVGAGGGGSTVQLFNPDGTQRVALDVFPGFNGGVRVAVADFTRDGVDDLAVASGPGTRTRVVVLDGVTQRVIHEVTPFDEFSGGAFVAVGDLDGDGQPDLVITPDEGGGPRARVFSGGDYHQLADFLAIHDPAFRGGARPAVGDINGDGVADLIVAAGFGGGPRVAVFDGKKLTAEGGLGGQTMVRWESWKLMGDFFVFEPDLRDGVFMAAGDLDRDGSAEVVAGAGSGGGPRVLALAGRELLMGRQVPRANFFAGPVEDRGGVRVAVKDLDGDGRADLITGAGPGDGTGIAVYGGPAMTREGAPTPLLGFDALPGFEGGVFVG